MLPQNIHSKSYHYGLPAANQMGGNLTSYGGASQHMGGMTGTTMPSIVSNKKKMGMAGGGNGSIGVHNGQPISFPKIPMLGGNLPQSTAKGASHLHVSNNTSSHHYSFDDPAK